MHAAIEINFLKERRKTLTKMQQRDALWLKWSAAATAILVVISGIAGAAAFLTSRSLSHVKEIQDQTKNAILASENVEKTFVLTFHKVEILGALFKDRQNKQEAINYFSTIFGPQVLVKQVEFQGEDQLLTFGLEAQDVFVLENVFDKLKANEVKEKFDKVTPSDLRRLEDGKYQMSVAVVL
jgi:hypothetical protein